MNKIVTTAFVRDLITENATYKSIDGYTLDVRDLDLADKRIFLSNILDANEFEWYTQYPTRLDRGIKIHQQIMQNLIDSQIDEMWHESMNESGLHKGCHKDNGEIYYY